MLPLLRKSYIPSIWRNKCKFPCLCSVCTFPLWGHNILPQDASVAFFQSLLVEHYVPEGERQLLGTNKKIVSQISFLVRLIPAVLIRPLRRMMVKPSSICSIPTFISNPATLLSAFLFFISFAANSANNTFPLQLPVWKIDKILISANLSRRENSKGI